MKLFDSHCHLEDERFRGKVPQVMERMRDNGVERCVLAGSDLPTSAAITELCAAHPGMVYGVVGVHPHEASKFDESTEAKLIEMLRLPGIVGIGEIGLDYYYDLSPRDTQKEVLEKQLALAYREEVPAVFHIRDAHGDFYDILRAHRAQLPSGVLHCFTGSAEMAKAYLDMGFYISFSGSLTFKNAVKLREAAAVVPLDRMLVETDSPYLAPVPVRGTRNEPANVRHVAAVAAEIKGVSAEELALTAYRNTCRLYGLQMPEDVLC